MVRIAKIMAILGVLALCGSAWGSEPIEGLIAYWTFDDGGGTVAEDSIGGNDGTLANGPVWTDGQVDGALSFDGIDDYVATALDIDQSGSNDITMVAWVYPTATSPYRQQVISTDNGGFDWSLLKRYGTWRVFTGDGSWDSGFSVDVDRWQHIAAVFKAGEDVIFYKNGVSRLRGSAPDTDISDNPVAIGDNPGWWYEYFEGKIDEVRIYDRTLSAAEIKELYHGELVALEVIGPDEVAENFEAQYRAVAHYERASVDVTDSADWSVEPNSNCSIEAGLLTTETIDLPEDVTITAQYGESEVTVEVEKQVSVLTICPSGNALDFDGVDDYVDVGKDAVVTGNAITVSAWVNSKAVGDDNKLHRIITRWKAKHPTTDSFQLYYEGRPSKVLGFGFQVNADSTEIAKHSQQLAPGQWYFVTGTYDGTSQKIYVNGIKQASVSNSGNVKFGSSYTTKIGRDDEYGGFWHFDGYIDEVTMWNRAFSAEEIQANMHRRLTGDEPNLVGYWDFDEGEGQVIYDLSGNGNDGQLGSTPNPDDSDPAWVESDAPVGICTLEGLVERNLIDVLDIKLNILDELARAMAKEEALLYMLNTSFENRDFGTAKKGDVVKAKQKIMGAIQQEERAETAVGQSIEKLDDALKALDIEVDTNSESQE